jgi:SAM-dependent methyltransferase
LVKFSRWLARQTGGAILNRAALVLDLGCGNGRNLIYLAKEFGVRGVGYDISAEAVAQAKKATGGSAPLEFHVRALEDPLPPADGSVALVLDLMSSHVLRDAGRQKLKQEILRVLKPGGFLCLKSFLLDEDRHAKRLLRDNPAGEGGYIHPRLGVYEHVWSEDEIEDFFLPEFEIHKIDKSHKHLRTVRLRGASARQAFRRRTFTAYLEKRV